VQGLARFTLTPEWREYTIDLQGRDLSRVTGVFCG